MSWRSLAVFAAVVSAATALAASLTNASGEHSAGPAGAQPRMNTRPTPGSRPTTHVAIETPAGRWAITAYRNELGELCIGPTLPDGGQGLGCADPAKLFEHAPVDLHVGGRQHQGGDLRYWDDVWLWGVAREDVASIEVVDANCSRQPLRLDEEGFFLRVYGASLLHRLVWPHQVVARDAAGTVLWSGEVPLSPPSTALSATDSVPKPRPSCT